MKIEVAKEGRMDMSGKGLIRAIQNNNMPLLDLFVRESIQNSLDAAKPRQERVPVYFGVGRFRNEALSNKLEGITDALNARYGSQSCSYLYVKDSETEGLTGPLHFSERKGNENGNLLKLVYEIAKPQERTDSGGSWGYGKTIYFRMGIGLVMYYSRIKLHNGKYQSRLAACLVENEDNPSALLKNPKLNSKRGLAWWGEEYSYRVDVRDEVGTIPVTDESEIDSILGVFGIDAFGDNETGTVIIIPYINESMLLKNNIPNDNRIVIPWISSVSEYLRIAVQRWYIARLNNPAYSKKNKQAWLEVFIDDERLNDSELEITFLEIRNLYNIALNGYSNNPAYYCEAINLNSLFKSSTVGYVAYRMFSAKDVGMLPPVNNPSPFVYVSNDDGQEDYKDGDVILTYLRKPGMTIAYDTCGEWVNKIKCHNENTGEILFAVFVLNSSNKFVNSEDSITTIEDYFRASEKADHHAWYDITVNDSNPRILGKIQASIGRKISSRYQIKKESKEEKSSSLSKMFSEYFLPPTGFGKRASRPTKKPSQGSSIVNHKSMRLTIRDKDVRKHGDLVTIPFSVEVANPVNNLSVSMYVAADGNDIALETWSRKTGLQIPFGISAVKLNAIQIEKQPIGTNTELGPMKRSVQSKSIAISLKCIDEREGYGLSISTEKKDLLVSGEFQITVRDVMAQMKFKIKDGE